MKINWRERLIAAAIHFFVTLLLAGLAAAVIFLVWFPAGLASLVGGAALFLLVVVSDLTLGPLLSLVIYSSEKPRRTLVIDYSVVGAVQLAALIYGLSVVAGSRPVFVAFDVDRLEVVTAIELDQGDLSLGVEPQYRSKSWLGPRLVAIVRPSDVSEHNDLVFSAVNGKDANLMPKYYRAFDIARTQAQSRSSPIAALLDGSGSAQQTIEAAIRRTNRSEHELRWLLVRHRFGFATALIDVATGEPIEYLAINPTWVKDNQPPSVPPKSQH